MARPRTAHLPLRFVYDQSYDDARPLQDNFRSGRLAWWPLDCADGLASELSATS